MKELRAAGLPEHVFDHVATMARLHAQKRYDRMTHDVENVLGRPARGAREFVARNPALFGQPSAARTASP